MQYFHKIWIFSLTFPVVLMFYLSAYVFDTDALLFPISQEAS